MSKLTDIKFILDSEGDTHPCPDRYMSAVIDGIDFKISRVDEHLNCGKFEDFVIRIVKSSHYTIAEELLNQFVDMMEDRHYVSDLLALWRKNTVEYLGELRLHQKLKGLRYVSENIKLMTGTKPVAAKDENGNLTNKPIVYTVHSNRDVACRIELVDVAIRIHLDTISTKASNLIFHYVYEKKSYAEISEEIRSIFSKDWLSKTLIDLRLYSNIGDIARFNALTYTFSKDKAIQRNQIDILSYEIMLTLNNTLVDEMNGIDEHLNASNDLLQKFHEWGLQLL